MAGWHSDLLVTGSRVASRKACIDAAKEIGRRLPCVVPESGMRESVPAGRSEDNRLVDAADGKVEDKANKAASKYYSESLHTRRERRWSRRTGLRRNSRAACRHAESTRRLQRGRLGSPSHSDPESKKQDGNVVALYLAGISVTNKLDDALQRKSVLGEQVARICQHELVLAR